MKAAIAAKIEERLDGRLEYVPSVVELNEIVV